MLFLSFAQLHADSCIGLETKWLRVLSLDGIGKTRNHLVANINKSWETD